MHIFKLYFFLFFIIFSYKKNLFAQNCATSESVVTQETQSSSNAFYRGEKLVIPVVVHIVWNKEEEKISDEQVFSQIEVLNQDFRKKNNQNDLPAAFQSLAADFNIEFVLAQYDPKGKATTGITRTFTTSKDVWQEKSLLNGIQRRKVYFTNIEGRDAWDTNRYLNIWVCKMPSGKSGYGTFPNQIKPDEADGIVVDYRYFGTKGAAAQNIPYHLGRTCTHEIGHFLNLQHLWGANASNSDCSSDDGVSDTPKQNGPIAGCPTFNVNHCGKNTMFQNFMNYADDDCMALFTEGQKQRAWDAIMTFRPKLSNQFVATIDIQSTDVQVFPNPAADFLNVIVEKNATCFLINMQGQKLLETPLFQGKNTLEIQNLQAGIYQLGIVIDNRQILKKIIIL